MAIGFLFVAATAAAPPACCAPQRISVSDDQDVVRTYGGDGSNLPVRPSLFWEEAVAWARTLPQVQLAQRTCEGRGYTAIAAHDTALNWIDPPATVVVLPYRKPGLVLPPNQFGQPEIIVVTRLNAEGLPTTLVTAGVLIVDPVGRAVFTADSLPAYAATDGSFDVVAASAGASDGGGGDGDPGNRRLSVLCGCGTNGTTSKFSKFGRCLGLGSLGCLRTFFSVTRYPELVVITFADPEIIPFYFGLCEMAITLGCGLEFYSE